LYLKLKIYSLTVIPRYLPPAVECPAPLVPPNCMFVNGWYNAVCLRFNFFFVFLLIVHLSIILDNDQLNTHLLYFTIRLL